MQQVDLLGKLQLSEGNTQTLTAVDVSAKTFFLAIHLRKDLADTVAQDFSEIFLEHLQFSGINLSDLWTVFTSNMMKELCHVLQKNYEEYYSLTFPICGISWQKSFSIEKNLFIYGDRVEKDWPLHNHTAVFVRDTNFPVSRGCTRTLNFPWEWN